ncbi:MAG TPA: hypothetical protein VL688_03445 [Verrucomicrobiae bacterium]|jgi:hypothetical protein|nr:hypothetical protein [Verrucomicrobiae bacterium]
MRSRAVKRSDIAAAAFGVFLCVLLLFLAETGTRHFWKEPLLPDVHYADDYFFTDGFGITKPKPSGRYHTVSRSAVTGNSIYDVTYSVDDLSRRITPVDKTEGRGRHLIFFGCSFTYGEGLQDDQTIPARTAARARGFMPYNYAFHGHSPTDMLRKLQSKTLPGEVAEKNGDLAYIFIDAHLQRVVGSMRLSTSWGKNRLHYELGPRDELVLKGDFQHSRPVLNRIYTTLSKSALLKFLKIDFPPRFTRRHYHLTARVIEESARLYKEQFPGGNFFVVIYPGSLFGKPLARELTSAGIQILDYSDLFNTGDLSYVLSPEDLHPSAKADDAVAARLARDLRLD